MLVKLEWLSYRTVKKLWHYVKPFSSDTGTSRTDRRTELLYQYRASVCWRAIKTRLTYVCVSVIRQVAAPCNALRYNITVANVRRYSPRGCCAFNALHCLWICYLSNKCIGDDKKGAARRSPNYIRKTKYVLWKFCEKTASTRKISLKSGNQSAAELWPKNVHHLEFWLSGCHRVPNVLLCTKFNQIQIIFCWDMAISRF